MFELVPVRCQNVYAQRSVPCESIRHGSRDLRSRTTHRGRRSAARNSRVRGGVATGHRVRVRDSADRVALRSFWKAGARHRHVCRWLVVRPKGDRYGSMASVRRIDCRNRHDGRVCALARGVLRVAQQYASPAVRFRRRFSGRE